MVPTTAGLFLACAAIAHSECPSGVLADAKICATWPPWAHNARMGSAMVPTWLTAAFFASSCLRDANTPINAIATTATMTAKNSMFTRPVLGGRRCPWRPITSGV